MTASVSFGVSGAAPYLAGAPLPRGFAHLPGESGAVAGALNVLGWMRRGNAHLLEQKRRYGPVYRHALGTLPMVFVADADALGTVVRNEHGAFSTGQAWKVFFEGINPSRSTFDTLLGMDFEQHRVTRRALQPAFSSVAVSSFVDQAVEIIDRTVTSWVRRGSVRLKPDARRLFAEVAGRIFIGAEDSAEGLRLDRAMADWWGAPLALIRSPVFGPAFRRAMRADRTFRGMMGPAVAGRRADGGVDLFSRICQLRTDESWLDDEIVVGLLQSVLSGAFDTTTLAIASMGYLLATHPEWQERLREEGRGRTSYAELMRCPQHDLVWKETLRLYPVGAGLPRKALRDVELAGRHIPADTFVLALIGPVLHDPTWWDRPHAFEPERFAPGRAEDKRHRAAYLPFGGGAHACIGMQLATLEAKALWAMLLSKCRVRLARDYRPRHEYRPLGSVSGDVELVLDPL